MKITAQIICETNKVIIQTPLEKFHMEYSDEMGKELFISLLLHNSFMMSEVVRNKPQVSILLKEYGKTLALFVVDGKFYDTIEVSLLDEDIDTSMTEILQKISTKKGRLYLVD
jgi:hypothetical protein